MKDDRLVCWLRWMRCGASPSRAKVAGWIAPPEIGIRSTTSMSPGTDPGACRSHSFDML